MNKIDSKKLYDQYLMKAKKLHAKHDLELTKLKIEKELELMDIDFDDYGEERNEQYDQLLRKYKELAIKIDEKFKADKKALINKLEEYKENFKDDYKNVFDDIRDIENGEKEGELVKFYMEAKYGLQYYKLQYVRDENGDPVYEAL